MKVICKISGIEFFSSEEFQNDHVLKDLHPIFKLPTRTILSKAKRYGDKKYSDREETLLFLSLLNTSKLVEWETAANPSISIVKQYLEPLFKLVAWVSEIETSSIEFPKYRVTRQNTTLDNISSFITALYEVRNEWRSPSSRKLLQDILENREIRLHKLIHSSSRNPTIYAGILASWAMDATNVVDTPKHPNRREVWSNLFKLQPDKDLFDCDLDELLSLQSHMETHLYAPNSQVIGTAYSAEVLKHLNVLVEMRKHGLFAFLEPSQTFSILSEVSFEEVENEKKKVYNSPYFHIDENENSHENKPNSWKQREQVILSKLAEMKAPDTLPVASNPEYVGKLSTYLRAKSAWLLSTDLRKELKHVRSQQ